VLLVERYADRGHDSCAYGNARPVGHGVADRGGG
jgi:hypothetical protein